MSDAPKTATETIQEKAPPVLSQIPFRLVEKHTTKTARLMANSGKVKAVEGQSRWFAYEFKEPVFIYRVVVNQTGYPDYRKFEIRATDLEGKEHTTGKYPQGNKVFLEVNQFCSKIEFRPPKAYFTQTTIESIEVYGFSRSDAGKFIQFARDIGSVKEAALADIASREATYQETITRAQKAEAERGAALKELSNLKSAADRQRAAIRRLESERSDLTTKISVLDDTLSKNTRERDLILAELESRSKQKEALESQTAELRDTLSGLKANIDLFPSELDSFVKQGARNNRTFFWLALAPILIIAAMFALLISGAVDLTTRITDDQDINLTALVASRMPYVVVSLAIITACYKIARVFISELIQVNRQRLNLTKVSIIAKDVSTAAEQGLNLNETDRYNLRVRLKMDLLKDHLKGYISSSPQILLPTRITDYFPFQNRDGRSTEQTSNGQDTAQPASSDGEN